MGGGRRWECADDTHVWPIRLTRRRTTLCRWSRRGVRLRHPLELVLGRKPSPHRLRFDDASRGQSSEATTQTFPENLGALVRCLIQNETEGGSDESKWIPPCIRFDSPLFIKHHWSPGLRGFVVVGWRHCVCSKQERVCYPIRGILLGPHGPF